MLGCFRVVLSCRFFSFSSVNLLSCYMCVYVLCMRLGRVINVVYMPLIFYVFVVVVVVVQKNLYCCGVLVLI